MLHDSHFHHGEKVKASACLFRVNYN